MFGSANDLRSGGRRERGVAGLSRRLRGAYRALVRGFRWRERAVLGPGLPTAGDGYAMEQRERGGRVSRLSGELAAKWSLLGMRPSRFPSPTLPGPLQGRRGDPQAWAGLVDKRVTRSC